MSTQLVRWVERQRAEQGRAMSRRRTHVLLAVATALVVLVGAAAALIYRPAVPWTQTPPAKELEAAQLPSGLWQASITHLHRNPPGGTRSLASVSLAIRPGGTGTVRLPDVEEPIAVRYERSGTTSLRVEADPAACTGLVLRLTGTVRADRFTVDDATAGPCYADPTVAAELVGATFIRQEQP